MCLSNPLITFLHHFDPKLGLTENHYGFDTRILIYLDGEESRGEEGSTSERLNP